MRRFVTAGALALFVALFAGCSDQETQTPTEPDFGKKNKVTYDCPTEVETQQEDLESTIRVQYLNNKAEKGALENVDNMARNICKEPQDLASARYTYFEFEIEVNKQPEHKLEDGEAGRQEILAKARAFVSGVPFDADFTIPPEALEEDGGVGVVEPGVPDTIWTNNLEAAFVAEAGSFAGNDPVTIVLTRLADPVFGTPGFPITGYQAFAEVYDISANQLLDGFAEFWMCVVEPLPEGVSFFDLVIGHDLGDGESELLRPPLYQGVDGDVIDCSQAAFQPVVIGSAGAPGWLQLAGTVLEPVVSRLLDVKPLNAMYFKGTGLGGRGGSLSPFGPVYPGLPVFNTMTVSGAGSGTGVITGGNGINCTWDGTASTGQCDTSVEDWVNLGLTATPDAGSTFVGWGGACTGTDPCLVLMDTDKTVTATFSNVSPPTTFLLSLAIASGNGQVTSNPTGISCREPFVTGDVCEGSFALGTAVVLSASPDDPYYYGTWTIDGAASETVACSRGSCSVTMNQAHDVTVSFAPDPPDVALELIVEEGSTVKYGVDAFGGDLTCNSTTCSVPLKDGDAVVLEVVSPLGTNTPVWAGVTCDEVDQTQPTCSFAISGNQTINFSTFPFIG